MTSPGPEIIIKMSLSVQRSIVESFKFNDKNIRVVHIKNVGQCFVGIDVSKAAGYNDDDNARRAVRTHVQGKYRMRLGDAQNIMRKEVNIDFHNKDIVLLKEQGLYCFLLRCKKPKAEPFMEWFAETVLPRGVRKLSSAIEEKDNQIQALEFINEKDKQKLLRLNEEIDDLIANRHVARRRCFDNVFCFIKKNSREEHPYYVIRCQCKQLEKHKRWLKLRYPNMEVVDKGDDPNAIHLWNRVKREVIKKPNYYKNHFSLIKKKQELFETALDVTI